MRECERFSLHNKLHKNSWSAAVYARLSDEDRNKRNKTDLSQSINNQIDFIRNYIEIRNEMQEDENSIIEYKVYSDDDRTGMNFNRGGFQQMMRDIKAGLVDCVIVKNVSRLGRYDTELTGYLEKEFEQSGREVRVICIGENYDSLYKEMDTLLKMILLMNREYSENQHRNVIYGMRSMQKNGKYVGAFAPYGYKKDPEDKHHLIPDEVASIVVNRIFTEYLAGISPKEIATGLTLDGIVNPSIYKKQNGSNYKCPQKISDKEVHWRSDTIKRILENETYTGTLVQHKHEKRKLIDKRPTAVSKDKWIRCENTHEPIISKDKWLKVQSMMKTIKHDITKPDEITIFKGLLKCGDCKHALRKKWEKYESKKTGKVSRYLYYNCGTFRDFSGKSKKYVENIPTCTSHYISDKVIRSIVIDDMNKIISQVKNLKEIVDNQLKNETSSVRCYDFEIRKKTEQIEIYNERLKGIKNKWYDGKISDEEYENDKEEPLRMIASLEREIQLLKDATTSVNTVTDNVWIKKLIEKGKLEELDRETVLEFIEMIYVYEDKHIEIVYRFSEEFDYLFRVNVFRKNV